MAYNKATFNHLSYIQQCRRVSKLLSINRSRYYSQLIENNEHNQRKLFQTLDKLLHWAPAPKHLHHRNAEDLANSFITFFKNKIENMRHELNENSQYNNIYVKIIIL